jgi:prephenate dehydrogenase
MEELEGRLPPDVHFIGSHPLAGSEKRGPEHASAGLFQDRLIVVTPNKTTDPDALDKVCNFWKALGSRIKLMSPGEHDEALAVTSHLPHVIASTLAQALPDELRELTASGFRDTTRIAAGDPALWTGILLHNRQAVLTAFVSFLNQLERFQAALQAGDEAALTAYLEYGKKVRDALGY